MMMGVAVLRGCRARTPATVTTETRDTHTGAQLLSPSIPLQRDPGLHPSFMYSLCFDVVVQLNSTSLRLNLHLTTVLLLLSDGASVL